MNNKTLLESLEKSSQMKYTEKKNAINLIDGQVARLPKEEEDEFVQHIQVS
jgi:hypothetical protein